MKGDVVVNQQGIKRDLAYVFLRLMLYFVITIGALQLIVIATQMSDVHTFYKENGILERFHFLLPFVSGLLLFWSGALVRQYATVLQVCAILVVFASVRELDDFSDRHVFVDAYKYLNAILLVLAVILLWRAKAGLLGQLYWFSHSLSFYFFIFGFILVVIYAQVIGQKELWAAIMADDFTRTYKSAVEESAETMGYLILLCGAIESFFPRLAQTPPPSE